MKIASSGLFKALAMLAMMMSFNAANATAPRLTIRQDVPNDFFQSNGDGVYRHIQSLSFGVFYQPSFFSTAKVFVASPALQSCLPGSACATQFSPSSFPSSQMHGHYSYSLNTTSFTQTFPNFDLGEAVNSTGNIFCDPLRLNGTAEYTIPCSVELDVTTNFFVPTPGTTTVYVYWADGTGGLHMDSAAAEFITDGTDPLAVNKVVQFDPSRVTSWVFDGRYFVPGPGSPHALVNNNMTVTSATYGANCLGSENGNATDNAALLCDGKAACNYRVDYTVLGDPAVGCGKQFVAHYSCASDGVLRTTQVPAEAGFGSIAKLSCP